ncbi:hypothetical protein JXM67_07890 [candidate division WOR-3 bacterium]|nr:hypothetical protein [candidate division WOR-3 bacterium]
MANLFWKTQNETKNLLSTPFKSEEEFEKIVFETPEILEDIFLIKRQVRGGKKPGIPDIVGIDNDGNVCIIEMKNVTVDPSIISQVLEYAFWAETNPDSIKTLWLECEDKPEEINISWDGFQVRIIVIAPGIKRSTLSIVERINYQVDLIEIRRWMHDDDQLLLVDKLEPEMKRGRTSPVSGLQSYDREYYLHEFNKESAKAFVKYVEEVNSLAKRKGWNLELKYNKYYCGFKAGFFNAFGIKWIGTKTFAFFFKLSQEEARRVNIQMTRYESQWKEAVYYIEPSKTKTGDFLQLFELSYRKLTGK